MAVIEREIVFTTKDSSGNAVINYPLTTIELVDGGVASVNGIGPDADGNVEIGAMPIGFEYFQTNPNVQAGSLPLLGGLFSREIYFDLWEWVQKQNGYLVTEAQWQALAKTNGGAVPYYSDGDGSTTFRVPALNVWCKGARGIEEIGEYLADSFKSHEHNVAVTSTGETASAGAHTHTASTSSAGEHYHGTWGENAGSNYGPFGLYDSNYNWSGSQGGFDYDNPLVKTSTEGAHSHTVTVDSNGNHAHTVTIRNSVSEDAVGSDETRPKTIVGIYCVIAFGSVTSSGSVSLDAVQNVLEETQVILNDAERIVDQKLVETEASIQAKLNVLEENMENMVASLELYEVYGETRNRDSSKPNYGLS